MARALRKDGKTKEIVELDLRELRGHRISFVPISEKILSEAEKVIATTDTFAADALHISTYKSIERHLRLEGFLCEDTHYERFKARVPVMDLNDFKL